MILLTLLLIILAVLIVAAVLLIGVGGGVFTVIFADVIVCIAIIVWLIRFFMKRRK